MLYQKVLDFICQKLLENNFHFLLESTCRLQTEDDADAIASIAGVESVVASHSQDMLCDTESSQLVLKMMSVPEKINLITIADGRLPEKTGECLADKDHWRAYT